MVRKGYPKGPKLFSLARKKALQFDIPQNKGIKLGDLICAIQQREGNIPCFQKRDVCCETSCCWQGSCGARMVEDRE